MQMPDHIATTREFLVAADREFEAGDYLQGSEKMWGAASHAVIAIAKQRGWRCNDHQSQKGAVGRLSRETGQADLRAGFATAEKLHANFYGGFILHYEFEDDREIVRDFVERVLQSIGETPQAAGASHA